MSELSPKSITTFMSALLAPIPEAELTDKEIQRLEDRARRDAKRRANKIWGEGWLRVEEAEHLRKAANLRRLIEGGAFLCPRCDAAERNWKKEVMRQMQLPAVMIRHLRWKEAHLSVFPRSIDPSALIEADKVRLGI